MSVPIDNRISVKEYTKINKNKDLKVGVEKYNTLKQPCH